MYGTTGDLTSKTVNGTTNTYGYDADDQLMSESAPSYSESYIYDGSGNRLTKTLGSVTDSYTYDNGDKLQSVKEGSTTVKSYSYDAQGRTTAVVSAAGTTSMSYDYEDRMTSITLPSGRTDTYTYNGEDTRTGMNSSAGSQTFKREGAGVTAPVLSDGLASYTPGVSRHTSSGSTFYGTDRQGTDSLQTSATGAVAATKVYDGFGMLVSTTGTPVGPFGYNGASGYQEDTDTGLMLLGHRYYDSSTGRFITRDPAKDGRNWYDYCGNKPLSDVDRTGYQEEEDEEGEHNGPVFVFGSSEPVGINDGDPNAPDPSDFHPIDPPANLPAAPVETNPDEPYLPNGGFEQKSPPFTLPTGYSFERTPPPGVEWSADNGQYVNPVGLSPESTSMTPSKMGTDPIAYEVMKEIPGCVEGKASPWYGRRGGGLQILLPKPIKWLIDNEYIRRV